MSHVQDVRIQKGQGKYQKEHVGILRKERKYWLSHSGKAEETRLPLSLKRSLPPTSPEVTVAWAIEEYGD